MDYKIPWTRHSIGAEEYDAVNRVLKSGWYSHGPEVEAFEKEICNYIGCKYAVCVSSGTMALQLAYLFIKKTVGIDHSIVLPSSSTFSATGSVPAAFGFDLAPIDVNYATALIDENTIEEVKEIVKGIFNHYIYSPVHLMGRTVDDIKKRDCDYIIEDACQAFGSENWGIKVGSNSELCVFSFHMAKLVTSVEGGCVVTNNKFIYDAIVHLRNHGLKENYTIDMLGTNGRMTGILAAIGRVQLKKAESAIEHRKNLVSIYISRLCTIEDVNFFLTPKNTTRAVDSIFAVKVSRPKDLKDFLARNSIDTRLFFPPLDEQLRSCNKTAFCDSDTAYKVWARGIMLPIGNAITEEEVRLVCDKIQEFYK